MSMISDNVREVRTAQINNFMSQFDNLNDVDVHVIEEGLRGILGEAPGVDFEYGVDISVNETSGKDERKKKLSKIHVYYSYVDIDDMVKASKVSYLVD